MFQVWYGVGVALIDVASLREVQPKAGWRGRFFHSAHMTFAYYEIDAGATLPPHAHENEEVWHVTGGVLEMQLGDERIRVGPGCAVVIPSGVVHTAVALEVSRAVVVDHPARREVAGIPI